MSIINCYINEINRKLEHDLKKTKYLDIIIIFLVNT